MSAGKSNRALGASPFTVTVAAATLLANLVFVLQPSLTFRVNGPFFAFSLIEHLALLVVIALAVAALLVLPGVKGSADWKSGYGALLAGLALALWTSSFVSSGPDASLDGSPIFFDTPLDAILTNIGILFAVAGIAYWLARRRPRDAAFFLLLLNLLFFGTAAVSAASGGLKKPELGTGTEWSTFSRSRNVVVILLDTFQASLFERLLAEGTTATDEFDGFTFFRNAVSPSPTTVLSLPAIHGGHALAPQERVSTYLTDSIVSNSFVAAHARTGYRAAVLNPLLNLCPAGAVCAQDRKVRTGYLNALAHDSLQLIDLSLFAVSPLQWKPDIYRDGEWLLGEEPIAESAREGYATLAWLTAGVSVDSGPPTLKFIHLMTTHPPAVLGADCTVLRDHELTEEALQNQARCSIAAVGRLLRALKTHNVYDNSTIVVLGDHGAGLSDNGFVLGGAASPLLLYKSAQAHGRPRTDDTVTALARVGDRICRETEACQPPGKRKPSDEDDAGRVSFAHYIWPANGWSRRDEVEINFYEVAGPPKDLPSWKRIGPPPPRVTKLEGTSADPWGVYGPSWVDAPPRDGKSIRWAYGPSAALLLQLPERRLHRIRMEVAPFNENAPCRMKFSVNSEARETLDLRVGEHAHVTLTVDSTSKPVAEVTIETEASGHTDFSLERRTPSFRLVHAAID
ncbi:MAG: sulfatase-like hydrolase/transferase [Burkholderiales bacterium]